MDLGFVWIRVEIMKTALVIGASGGIGSAMVQELKARGFAVTGLSRRINGLDVTDGTSVKQVMEPLDGPFDVVFVAIGTLAAGGTPEKALSLVDPVKMKDCLLYTSPSPRDRG